MSDGHMPGTPQGSKQDSPQDAPWVALADSQDLVQTAALQLHGINKAQDTLEGTSQVPLVVRQVGQGHRLHLGTSTASAASRAKFRNGRVRVKRRDPTRRVASQESHAPCITSWEIHGIRPWPVCPSSPRQMPRAEEQRAKFVSVVVLRLTRTARGPASTRHTR